jgi:hypothetical protein
MQSRVQRWSVRLLAYQAGLVDAYPPFRLGEAAGHRRGDRRRAPRRRRLGRPPGTARGLLRWSAC